MTEIEQAIKRIELGDNVGIVLQEYALNYHEQQVSKLPIPSVSGFHYLRCGEIVKNGDEYFNIEDDTWNIIDDAGDGYEYEGLYMCKTRRKRN